jgi:glycosyltransferase involved in cell wall biosynthesis
LAGDQLNKTIFFTNMVPGSEVSKYLAAMDVASLPQSRDGVGNFRYTTKISEYAAAGLPIVTGRLPLAYDLDDGSMWRLPGYAPWSVEYVDAMKELMESMSAEKLALAKSKVHRIRPEFDPKEQVDRITRFITDLLEELPSKTTQSKRQSTPLAIETSPQ